MKARGLLLNYKIKFKYNIIFVKFNNLQSNEKGFISLVLSVDFAKDKLMNKAVSTIIPTSTT
uniref:Uncharacterized protein n=1 Tax=Salix viminalis TaxID=40686 RepID=A0A6N2N603_SALVM